MRRKIIKKHYVLEFNFRSLFLKIAKDGSVFTWGRAVRGQLGREPEPQDHPKSVNLNAPGQSKFAINIKFYPFIWDLYWVPAFMNDVFSMHVSLIFRHSSERFDTALKGCVPKVSATSPVEILRNNLDVQISETFYVKTEMKRILKRCLKRRK